MKIIKLIIIIFGVNLIAINANAFEECSDVYSALVFKESDGEILFENRSDNISYPASLVKVMTLYLTFEALENNKISMDQNLTVSGRGEEIARINKINTLKLKQGDKITVKQAIGAVIVKSFNEAAVTLAEGVAGDEWEFARKMNEKARELKMLNTSFRNASGLHEEGQYTTSYDLARLVKAIKQDFPEYYKLFSLKEFTYKNKKYETHNYVLLDYKGAEGMKTGFTNAAGFNLISSATKNNDRIFSILLGCAAPEKRNDFTMQLLDDGFAKLSDNDDKKRVKISNSFSYLQK